MQSIQIICKTLTKHCNRKPAKVEPTWRLIIQYKHTKCSHITNPVSNHIDDLANHVFCRFSFIDHRQHKRQTEKKEHRPTTTTTKKTHHTSFKMRNIKHAYIEIGARYRASDWMRYSQNSRFFAVCWAEANNECGQHHQFIVAFGWETFPPLFSLSRSLAFLYSRVINGYKLYIRGP